MIAVTIEFSRLGRFHGGRLSAPTERLLADAILALLAVAPHARPVDVYAHVRRALDMAGLPGVSPSAVGRRASAILRWLEGERFDRVRFCYQIPVDLALFDVEGLPVGRPLITFSGTIIRQGRRVMLDAEADVSLPYACPRKAVSLFHQGRGVLSPAREEFHANADIVLRLLDRPGSGRPFVDLAHALGSRVIAEAVVRELVQSGWLLSPVDRGFEDATVIRRAIDDPF